jgi:fructosamine-3-kinase
LRAGTLDQIQTAQQVGVQLSKLHQLQLQGFGFLDTSALGQDGKMIGLCKTNLEYYQTRLADHLTYLQESQFLTMQEVQEIQELIQKFGSYLNIPAGSLLHKNISYSNLVGLPSQINGIIDWDDSVIGDPIDDLAVIRCNFDESVFNAVVAGYQQVLVLPNDFYPRFWLYLIRNMLCKIMYQTFMKYFEMDEQVAELTHGATKSMKQSAKEKLYIGVNGLKSL